MGKKLDEWLNDEAITGQHLDQSDEDLLSVKTEN